MGKTTLLKYLFLNCVTQEAGIPIFIELRKLSKKKRILEFILEQLADAEGKCRPELFFKLLASGEFVFFLDGYDEIPESERSEVTASIQQFIEKTPGNKFIVTSRDEMGLAAFSQFQRYTIQPLQKTEAYTLLRKYAEESLAETLIAKLELPENAAIHEFLTNPLLTSLLFKSFEYKQIIPLKRHIFYRQVYEALYESHDLTKEGGEYQRQKRSGLDIDRLEQVLRSLGALTYKASKTEFTKEVALEFLTSSKTLSSENKSSASNILHDLTHAVPLLIVDGNYIRWSHRSIQEYFAAQYICKNTKGKQSEILLKYFEEKDVIKHTNLILLCADIDKSAFDQSIGKKIAKDLLTEFDSTYIGIYSTIAPAVIKERKELVVGRPTYLIRSSPPMDSLDEEIRKEWDIKVFGLLQRMRDESEGVQEVTGGSLINADPGIGQSNTKTIDFLNVARHRLHIPFVIDLPFRTSAVTGDDCVDKSIDFIRLNDDPLNPLNAEAAFGFMNSLLHGFVNWKFDSAAAREYLIRVDEEEKAKMKIEPW